MKTVIIGATPNKTRYAYFAAQRLRENEIEFVPVGIKSGDVLGVKILNLYDKPKIDNVHTVTMYIGPQHQTEWYDYILSLNPKRIIFNPGTENHELSKIAETQGVNTEFSCTLTMLGVGNYSEMTDGSAEKPDSGKKII